MVLQVLLRSSELNGLDKNNEFRNNMEYVRNVIEMKLLYLLGLQEFFEDNFVDRKRFIL